MEDLPDLSTLGTRRGPRNGEWVAVDTAPPPKPKRRLKKMLKREAAAAAKAAVAAAMSSQQCSPNSKRPLSKQELQELSRKALEETYQRVKLKKEPRDPSLKCLSRENEEGNVEYKLRLKEVQGGNPYRIQQLITQMKYRLAEGNGECFYYIGVEDDGYPKGLEGPELQASLSTLHFMAAALGAHVQIVRQIPGASARTCALARVRRETPEQVAFMDLRVAVSGGVDSGKSSLVAVLSHGSNGAPALDNGRGSARMSVLKHKHELESGRTSSISQQVLGYGADGEVLNYAGVSSLTPTEISLGAKRLLTFIDMGGHERCLKTCLWGMTCMLPDYAVLCICAAGGLGRMSKEHLAVAVALEVPVAVVLTKCDLVDSARLDVVLGQVRALLALALPGLRPEDGQGSEEELEAIAPLVDTAEGAREAAAVLCHMRAAGSVAERRRVMVPVFATSSVTGAGLQLLHSFLRELRPGVQLREQAAQTQGPGAGLGEGPCNVLGQGGHRGGHGLRQGLEEGEGKGKECEMCGAVDDEGAEGDHAGGGADEVVQQSQQPQQQQQQLQQQVDGEQQVSYSLNPDPTVTAANPLPADSTLSSGSTLGADVRSSLRSCSAQDAPVMFQVDQTFDLHGVGSVVCGTVVQGIIKVGTALLLGPDETGGFMPVQVSGIQRMHTPVAQVRAGQTAALALMPVSPYLAGSVGLGVEEGLAAASVGVATGVTMHETLDAPGLEQQQSCEQFCQVAAEFKHEAVVTVAPVRQAATTCMQQQQQEDEEEDLFACLGDFEEEDEEGGNADGEGQGTEGQDDTFAAALVAFQDRSPTPAAEAAAAAVVRGAVTAAVAARVAGAACRGATTASHVAVAAAGVADVAGVGGGVGGVASGDADVGFQLHRVTRTSILSPGPAMASHSSKADQLIADQSISDQSMTRTSVKASHSMADMVHGYDQQLAHNSTAAGARRAAAVSGGPAAVSGGLADSGGSDDWQRVCELATSPPAPNFLSQAASPPNSRKGAVLLDASLLGAPGAGTLWEFEAVVVLLGGRWPARGLLSGRWPPQSDEPHAPNRPPLRGSCGVLCGAGGVGTGVGTDVESVGWRCGSGAPRCVSVGGAASLPPLPHAAFHSQRSNNPQTDTHTHIHTLSAGPSDVPGSLIPDPDLHIHTLSDEMGAASDTGPAIHGGCQVPPHVSSHRRAQMPLPTGSAGASDSDTGTAVDQQPSPQRPRGRGRRGVGVGAHHPGLGLSTGPTPASSCTSLASVVPGVTAGAGVGQGVGQGVDASPPRAGRRLTRHSSTGGLSGPGEHMVVLHCGSVRQAAHVVWMQEAQGDAQAARELDSIKYRAILATAAILHHGTLPGNASARGLTRAGSGGATGSTSGSASGSDEGDSPRTGRRDDLGCVVRARFRFSSRPEWLRQGARLIIRDISDGHIAGAGFLDKLN